jgi:periplasmic nitrate reductase NapE
MSDPVDPLDSIEKKQELRLFLFIVIFLFPLLSIALVGGFGFIIWISQLILGPPSY